MRILLLGVAFLFIGCEPEVIIPKKNSVYTIAQGSHYSTPRFLAPVRENKLSFRANLKSSTIYEIGGGNQINKLFGFSDCSTAHQENSARFGWMYENGEMRIYTYTYVNGRRIYEVSNPLAIIDVDRTYTYHLIIDGSRYIFQIETPEGIKEQIVERGCSGDNDLQYTLTPYFGGQTPAPHEMKIELELI